MFRIGETDAKRLQGGFSSFDFTDLQGLGRGEAIVRIEQPKYDCSLETNAFAPVSDEEREHCIDLIISHSRTIYAKDKSEVEKVLSDTLIADMTSKEDLHNEAIPIQNIEEPIAERTQLVPEISTKIKSQKPVTQKDEKKNSGHRYLQMLVKKMAEAMGYTAVIEQQLSGAPGHVDVLLSKENKTIAVEICNTTVAEWEVHNISKCISADYTLVVSLSVNVKQLEKIKKKCILTIPHFDKSNVLFLTPDSLFQYLDEEVKKEFPQEQNY